MRARRGGTHFRLVYVGITVVRLVRFTTSNPVVDIFFKKTSDYNLDSSSASLNIPIQ